MSIYDVTFITIFMLVLCYIAYTGACFAAILDELKDNEIKITFAKFIAAMLVAIVMIATAPQVKEIIKRSLVINIEVSTNEQL